MTATQTAEVQKSDDSGVTLAAGARVNVFPGTDRATVGTLIEDFGDVLDAAGDTAGTGVEAPRRFAVHTDEGLLVFADAGDVAAIVPDDAPAVAEADVDAAADKNTKRRGKKK